MNNQRLMELAGVKGKQLNEQDGGHTFTVNTQLSDQDLQSLVDNLNVVDDVEELKKGLMDFQKELSTKEGLYQILEELDYFNV